MAAPQRAHAQCAQRPRQILDGAPGGARVLVRACEQGARRGIAARERPLRVGEVGRERPRRLRQPALALGQRVGREDEGGHDQRDGRADSGLPDALDRIGVGILRHHEHEQGRDRDLRVQLGAGAQEQADRETDDEQQDDRRGRDAGHGDGADAEHHSGHHAEHAAERERERGVRVVADGDHRDDRREDGAIRAQEPRDPPGESRGDRDPHSARKLFSGDREAGLHGREP